MTKPKCQHEMDKIKEHDQKPNNVLFAYYVRHLEAVAQALLSIQKCRKETACDVNVTEYLQCSCRSLPFLSSVKKKTWMSD